MIILLGLSFIAISIVTLKIVLRSYKDQSVIWVTGYVSIFSALLFFNYVKSGYIQLAFIIIYSIVVITLFYRILIKKHIMYKINKSIEAVEAVEDIEDIKATKAIEVFKNNVNKIFNGKVIDRDLALFILGLFKDNINEVKDTIEEEYYEELFSIRTLAINKYAPVEVLEFIVTDADLRGLLSNELLDNPSSTPDILKIIALSDNLDNNMIRSLVKNPSLSDETIGIMLGKVDTLENIVNKRTSKDDVIRELLAEVRKRRPELTDILDRFIIANYSSELLVEEIK